MATVYAVASGKGGVGKTTTAVNLGTVLADGQRRVAIVDADIGMADLAELVSLQPDGATLEEVLGEEAGIGDATYRLTEGLYAVPSARDLAHYSVAITEHLEPLVDRLREAFDVVVIDVGAGISQESVMPLGLADRTLLVTTPDPTAVRGAGNTATLVDSAGGRVAGTVCTRVRDDDDPEAVVESLPGDLLAAVPEDPAVRDSIATGVPLVAHAPDSPAAAAYREFADRIADRVRSDRRTGDAPGESEPSGTGHDEVARRVGEVDTGTEVEADGGEGTGESGGAADVVPDTDDGIVRVGGDPDAAEDTDDVDPLDLASPDEGDDTDADADDDRGEGIEFSDPDADDAEDGDDEIDIESETEFEFGG